MQKLRTFLCWLFAISSLLCLRIAFLRILHTFLRHDAFLPLRRQLALALFSDLAIIFGMAWWTVWRGKPFAKCWGITASLMYIFFPIWNIIYFSRSVWHSFGVMFATGVAGLVAFLWRDEQHGSSKNPRQPAD